MERLNVFNIKSLHLNRAKITKTKIKMQIIRDMLSTVYKHKSVNIFNV